MKKESENRLFPVIRDFLLTYLPKHRQASDNTIRAYRKALELFIDYLKSRKGIPLIKVDFDLWTHDNICAFLDHLESKVGCRISTRNHRLHCLKAFTRYASMMQSSFSDLRLETLKVPDKKDVSLKRLDCMSEKAMKTLLGVTNKKSPRGLRDRTILFLLYDTASRVQELLNIRICDLDLGEFPSVRLFGKGAKTRSVPLSKKLPVILKSYLSVYHSGESLHSTAPLFYTQRSGTTSKMTPDNIRRIVRFYGKQARQNDSDVPERVHPHMFRHSRAMHLYKGGLTLPLLSELLGHSKIETTLIYAHADAEMKRKALAKIDCADGKIHGCGDIFTESDEGTIKKLYGLV
ncbi:MAG: tyrosine-type recombinase/integrase [Kiritimatiellae bacterium]|nr:tyrosine-type recombinase/integrase [Kiritimatiellia bacterium]